MFHAQRGKPSGLPSLTPPDLRAAGDAFLGAGAGRVPCGAAASPTPVRGSGASLARYQVPLPSCAPERSRPGRARGLPQGGGGGAGPAELGAGSPLLKRFSRVWGAAGCCGGIQEWAGGDSSRHLHNRSALSLGMGLLHLSRTRTQLSPPSLHA